MRRKCVCFILVLVMCAGMIQVAAADTTPYTVGTTVSGTRQENEDVWYTVRIETDGLYEVLHSTTTTSNYQYGGGRVMVYDKTGSIEFYINDTGYTVTEYVFNTFEQAFIHEYAVFLHKGEYLLKETGGRGVNTYTFSVNKISTPYGLDRGINDTDATAGVFAYNGRAGGNIGGRFEDGTKDKNDYYAVKIPEPTTAMFYVEADRGNVAFYVYNENGKELGYLGSQTSYVALKQKYLLEKEITFEQAGIYYLRIEARYTNGLNDRYTPYLLTMGDGSGSQPKVAAVQTGTKIMLPGLTSGIGFSIYRSETQGALGVKIAGPVSGASFIDVNVTANTTYYYTVFEMYDDNTTSEESDKIAVTTQNDIAGGDIVGEKSFILMKIGEPTMSVGGLLQEIDPGRGTVPVLLNGRTLVPIRAIIEAMHGSVGWDNATQKVTLDAIGHHIEMWLEQKQFLTDGSSKEMDIAPTTLNGRTMLPIRFVVENLGCAIEWIGSTQEIIIVFVISG